MLSFGNWMKDRSDMAVRMAKSDEEQESAMVHFVKFSPLHGYAWSCPEGQVHYSDWRRRYWAMAGPDLAAGAEAIERCCGSSWWEWDAGSRPFHWRWPKFYQKVVRDGLPIYLTSKAPVCRSPQRDIKELEYKLVVVKKLTKVRKRGYIGKWDVVSLTTFFWVPKGETDVRIVYDGTASGLNDATWVPSFWLPTVKTELRMIGPGTHMGDVMWGKCF